MVSEPSVCSALNTRSEMVVPTDSSHLGEVEQQEKGIGNLCKTR